MFGYQEIVVAINNKQDLINIINLIMNHTAMRWHDGELVGEYNLNDLYDEYYKDGTVLVFDEYLYFSYKGICPNYIQRISVTEYKRRKMWKYDIRSDRSDRKGTK